MRIHIRSFALIVLALSLAASGATAQSGTSLVWVEGKRISAGIGRATALPARMNAAGQKGKLEWLRGPVSLTVRNEATNATAVLTQIHLAGEQKSVLAQARMDPLELSVAQQWIPTASGLTWDLVFTGEGKRAGHEIVLDLPILSRDSQIFTPSNRGIIDVAGRPTFKPPEYAHFGMFDGVSYVLPLVSVFSARSDSALTIALPPDANIPHLQVEWKDARVLRLILGHRGMGGGKPSAIRLLFYAHAADYRAVLKAYSDEFPAYFRPVMPREGLEGAFYYHHIQAHPSFEELARQRVRYIWSSFWFTHVGEYLPAGSEWMPFTYSNTWRLGEMMSDEKIRAFIRKMNQHGIGVFAFFNVDEYGGLGVYNGRNVAGDSPEIDKWRNARFPDALVRDAEGKDIPSWEGCKVLNVDRRYSFYPHLMEQVRRYLDRLPEIEGFVIDRMDWASILDYGHSDGSTMAGGKAATNMALPIAAAVQDICRMSHERGKRVFINQFYRVEVLRDVDGFCHENDYPPALGYLTPYRPVSAWHWRKPYHGDLLAFEAQLKRRLQFAVFPQMIAHEFPISQQEPDPRAADLLEIYAPLFLTLLGKEQVLLPHSVAATGANDVNLFINRNRNYIAPVTSRTRFLSRRTRVSGPVTVTMRVPDAAELMWAHVYSADGAPYRAKIVHGTRQVQVTAGQHGSVSMVVVGRGQEPPIDEGGAARLSQLRERLFPLPEAVPPAAAERPMRTEWNDLQLRVEGKHVGDEGTMKVRFDGKEVGELTGDNGSFPIRSSLSAQTPELALTAPDEGVWFVPARIELIAKQAQNKGRLVAEWTPELDAENGASTRETHLRIRWVR